MHPNFLVRSLFQSFRDMTHLYTEDSAKMKKGQQKSPGGGPILDKESMFRLKLKR